MTHVNEKLKNVAEASNGLRQDDEDDNDDEDDEDDDDADDDDNDDVDEDDENEDEDEDDHDIISLRRSKRRANSSFRGFSKKLL